MSARNIAESPMVQSRIAGVLFIIMAVAAELSTGVLGVHLVVPGDAAATAANLAGTETQFRTGILGHIVVLFADAGVSILLYVLLRPVSRTLALMAASFRLVMVAMRGINLLTHFAVSYTHLTLPTN